MNKYLLTLLVAFCSIAAWGDNYDQNEPFGFCTVSSRTDASSTFNMTGGGCYTYPIPDSFTGKVIVLKSTGQDMKTTIQNAISQNDVIILDGSDGDFIVSSNVEISKSGKTLLGINNARLCTKWYVTDEIKAALTEAKVASMSTSSGTGGTLSNGRTVSEKAEFHTRQIIIDLTGDNNESYRNSGVITLKSNSSNIIIRNITFVGPGSIDAGGSDLISCTGAKHCWIDHCDFTDGMDGNFDITNSADFITVSWCTFRYTSRSYMHENTNLVGRSDDEAQGYLNTTFAFNWWGPGCKQRMPMARAGKIHMLNNFFNCSGASNCINPRKNSEFLIEGNYFASGVKKYYSQNDATAVTWTSNNYIAEASSLPSSIGSTVTVPYDYDVAPYADVPSMVQANAGATLPYGESSMEPEGTKGSIFWSMSEDTNAEVATAISDHIASTSVTSGSNLVLRTKGTYNNIRFSLYQAQSIQTVPSDDNAVTFKFTTKSGYKFKASSIELYACKVGTNNGTIDISWKDAGGKSTILAGVSPNRNNAENNYYSYYNKDINSSSTATDGTCELMINLYNVGANNSDGSINKKDIGLAQVIIMGSIIDPTGISTPVMVTTTGDGYTYNLQGQRVDSSYRGIVIKNGKKYLQK